MSSVKKLLTIRWILLIISLIGNILLILNNTICTDGYKYHCFLAKYDKILLVPASFIFLSFFVISIFTFFISDKAFKKWLIFGFFWLIMDIIFVINSPANPSSGYISVGPETKEDVSRWMGFFFIFASLAMFMASKIKNVPLWKKWIYGILIFIAEVILVFMFS